MSSLINLRLKLSKWVRPLDPTVVHLIRSSFLKKVEDDVLDFGTPASSWPSRDVLHFDGLLIEEPSVAVVLDLVADQPEIVPVLLVDEPDLTDLADVVRLRDSSDLIINTNDYVASEALTLNPDTEVIDVLSEWQPKSDESVIHDDLCHPRLTVPEVIDEMDERWSTSSQDVIDDILTDTWLTVPKIEDVLMEGWPASDKSLVLGGLFDIWPTPPEIVSLLEPLDSPSVAGKSYVEEDQTSIGEAPVHQTSRQTDRHVRASRERLLYGAHRTPSVPETAQVVDVFEQLRYILQPPIFKPSGQPVIFPNGHRPYPFQIVGVNWLVEREHALLADQMGLGKTIQAIIAMRVMFRKGSLQRVLVICPASMTSTWEREVRSWAPELRVLNMQAHYSIRRDMWDSPAEVYIVSYDTFRHDGYLFHNDRYSFRSDNYLIESDRFDLCVIDEAQKIKNDQTYTHRAVTGLKPKYRWALTGTPIENVVNDLVSIFDFVNPNLFRDYSWIFGRSLRVHTASLTESEVRRRIDPYVLRRTIEQVELDLPPITHQEHWLGLTVQQRTRYDNAEKGGVDEIRQMGDSATRIHILALITKLKQICNYDDESGHSSKLEFLQEGLSSLVEANEKALVFSQYPNKTLDKIKPDLEHFKPLMYSGTLTRNRRDAIVEQFQTQNDNSVLLMSVLAGGLGLTLTRANHVFHFDHWWNPATVDQATARVRRIGQAKPVFVHSLYTTDTIEQRISELLNRKRDLFRRIIGDLDDKGLERLSDADLFGLFELEPPEASKTVEQPIADPHESVSSMSGRGNFLELTPEEFEVAVGKLFQEMGYNLTVTKKSGDGGIDLDGFNLGLGGGRVVVQCKRYMDTVSVSAVRDLFGVVASDNSIERGFLVTTGRISQAGKDFARGKRITLIEGEELEWRARNVSSR